MRTPDWRGWVREPLLHFLLIGTGLFAVWHFVAGGDAGPTRDIVVSTSQVEALATNFQKTWSRPPTAQELRGLVDDYVTDEVYYREAIAMGIDRDDQVIRRRLRQKMEFMSDSVADAAEPTDAQLEAFLREHASKFTAPERLTFEQVFVSIERRGGAAPNEAARILTSLRAGRGPADPRELGDPTLLPTHLQSASAQEIAYMFGGAFAAQVAAAPVGSWSGPVKSTFGLHLVRVDQREPGRLPPLAEIRPVVLREWQATQGTKAREAFLAQLRSKYRVSIEGLAGPASQAPVSDSGRNP
ncbi:peptidyl-prolyl cis-trans isomerase [Cupriavidus sp. BIS7]|uniref:peptidylprolyl isomerase n=1 Tax=Cupriavidus sp. BIS7 TaxID=1217718 RepID=UPI000314D846|nr:peptidyl-prolyl cis-trans isomerase [Cupriavidus sp. BIS7]